MPRRTYYDILGVPMGASIDHIKASYRLLTRKTLITDVAYQSLTAPENRREYNAWLVKESPGDEDKWGKRGRERCSCGAILQPGDEWNCPNAGQLWNIMSFLMPSEDTSFTTAKCPSSLNLMIKCIGKHRKVLSLAPSREKKPRMFLKRRTS